MLTRLARIVNPNSDRIRLWSSFLGAIRRYATLGIGFSLWWAWVFLTCQSTAAFPVVAIADYAVPTGLGPLLCIATTLLATAVAYRRKRFILQGMHYYTATAVTMTLGAALCTIWCVLDYSLNAVGLMLWGVSSLLFGVSSAFMYIEFNRIMGWLGLLKTLFFAITSTLVGSLIAYAFASLSPIAMHALFTLLPSLMVAILARTIQKESLSTEYFSHGNEAELPIPFKFIFTSFAEGLSSGLILGSITVTEMIGASFGIVFLGHLAAITLLVVATFMIKLDFNRLIYQVAFPLMGLGFLVIGGSMGNTVLGESIQLVGYCFLDLLLWGLGSYLIKNACLPAIWITACPSGALFSGLAIGGLCGVFIIQPLDAQQLSTFFSIIAFALVVAALFLFNKENFEHGWGTIKPGESERSDKATDRCCSYLSIEYELTPRERDVFELIARNVARKDIAIRLFLSENTVKTHTRNIFRKLQVTTREELLALVRRTEKMLQGD